jgi:hypothetical protein
MNATNRTKTGTRKQNVRPLAVPATLRRSLLMSRGGFDVFEGFHDERFFGQLLLEAQLRYHDATACDIAVSDGEEVRGGIPERRFCSSPGGTVQDSFYRASWVLELLRELTVPELAPSGERGTYSYYVRPGDFLGIHRDIVNCEVAVITCLSTGATENNEMGSLCLYPERIEEPLSAVRAAPDKGALNLHLQPGQTIVMYGGLIPHTLRPTPAGQTRIVSVLCYQIPDA